VIGRFRFARQGQDNKQSDNVIESSTADTSCQRQEGSDAPGHGIAKQLDTDFAPHLSTSVGPKRATQLPKPVVGGRSTWNVASRLELWGPYRREYREGISQMKRTENH